MDRAAVGMRDVTWTNSTTSPQTTTPPHTSSSSPGLVTLESEAPLGGSDGLLFVRALKHVHGRLVVVLQPGAGALASIH